MANAISNRQNISNAGTMKIRTYLESRILTITIVHSHHKPYVHNNLDAAVLEFIEARVTESTPSHIYAI